MDKLAILAGRGELPVELLNAKPESMVVTFEDIDFDLSSLNHFRAEFEKTGALFKALEKEKITHICFAGAVSRPEFKMSKLDFKTISLMPKIQKAIASSDGKTLSIVRSLVEGEGFQVVGAHEICPDMVVTEENLTTIKPKDDDGLKRAIEIHEQMSRLDIGQALAMRKQEVLAMESSFGTQAMLEYVAKHSDKSRKMSGFLYKASKIDQDLMIDMASIGPDTVDQVLAANLAGIYVKAGHVIIINKGETIRRANEAGIFIKGIE